MKQVVTNKITQSSTGDLFDKLANQANKITIAVAFFSDSTVIKNLLNSGKNIVLIVSLRPPTNYYSLKELLHRENIEISFLGDEFHSKIYSFFNIKGEIISSMIGSSNFTNGGLKNNIETNLATIDINILKQIENSLLEIENISIKLQPDTLRQYKSRYDRFVKYREKDKNPIRISSSKTKVKKDYKYLDFWKVADEIKDIVSDISKRKYPTVPEYLVIDHFWHWIVKIRVFGDRPRIKYPGPE